MGAADTNNLFFGSTWVDQVSCLCTLESSKVHSVMFDDGRIENSA